MKEKSMLRIDRSAICSVLRAAGTAENEQKRIEFAGLRAQALAKRALNHCQ